MGSMSSGLFRFIIWMHFTTSRPFLYAHQYFSKIGWKKFVLFLDYNERIEPQHTNDYCFGTVFSFHQFQFHFVFGFCFVPLTHTVRWLGWNVIDSDRIFLADASFLGYLFPLNWLYTCIIRHCRLYIGWFALPDTLILLVSSYTPELFGCRSGERPRDKTHLFFSGTALLMYRSPNQPIHETWGRKISLTIFFADETFILYSSSIRCWYPSVRCYWSPLWLGGVPILSCFLMFLAIVSIVIVWLIVVVAITPVYSIHTETSFTRSSNGQPYTLFFQLTCALIWGSSTIFKRFWLFTIRSRLSLSLYLSFYCWP